MDNFFLFVQQGAFDEVFSLVDSKLADVNSIDSYGCTALHWAAMNNRLQIAELLLANGADVNKPGGDLREIPIQWTVRNEGLFAMTVLLLQHGSNIQHQNIYGQDSLVLACQAGNVNAAFMM